MDESGQVTGAADGDLVTLGGPGSGRYPSGSHGNEASHSTHPLPDKHTDGHAVYDLPPEKSGNQVSANIQKTKDGGYYLASERFDDSAKNADDMRTKLKSYKAKYAGWEPHPDDDFSHVKTLENKDELRQVHLRGATGVVRTEMLDGREHIVVPVIALMDTVIHAVNASTPERVPLATLQKAAASWNGRPVVLGHPTRNGRQISANEPGVLATHGLGTIFNSRVENGRLQMEAWHDVEKTARIAGQDYVDSIRAAKPHEVSVGAFVVTDGKAGTHPNGRDYKASWVDTTGDHLAMLPNGRGACSMEMGCGAHRSAMHLVTAENFEVLGGPGSGPRPGHGHSPQHLSNEAHKASDKAQQSNKPEDHLAAYQAHSAAAMAHGYADIPLDKTSHGSEQRDRLKQQIAGHELQAKEHLAAYGRSKTYGSTQDRADARKINDHHDSIQRLRRDGKHVEAKKLTLKGAQMEDKKSIREQIVALVSKLRGAAQDSPADEAAELVQYETIQSLLQQCGDSYDETMGIVKELIAAESNETADEEAEEAIEEARLEAINAHCLQMMGSLSGIMNITRALLADDADTGYPRYMEAAVEARALVGKRHSMDDQSMVQAVHDHSVALGADCAPKVLEETELETLGGPGSGPHKGGGRPTHEEAAAKHDYAAKMNDLAAKKPTPSNRDVAARATNTALAHSQLTHNLPQIGHEAANSAYYLTHNGDHKEAAGNHREVAKMHREANLKSAQATEDTTQATEDTDGKDLKAAADHSCTCGNGAADTGDIDMTKVERIKALVATPGYVEADVKWLEAVPDERLTALEAQATDAATLKAAADKTAADLKAAQEAATKAATDNTALEARLKAAEANMIPAEELAGLRTMAAAKKAQDETRHAELVTVLKAAQSEFTEEELKAQSLTSLERFARMTKTDTVDQTGRIMPRAAASQDAYAAPDPYAAGIKALQTTVN